MNTIVINTRKDNLQRWNKVLMFRTETNVIENLLMLKNVFSR